MSDKIYDVVIIGGGPAGLTAGIYACRSALKTILFEQLYIGGQVITTDKIENYPGFPDGINGVELMEKLHSQALNLGLEIKEEEIIKIEESEQGAAAYIVSTTDNKYTTSSVIISSGVKYRKLDVPGEENLVGRGVSYCATCDAAFFRNKTVITIGGGNSALEEALFVSKFAAKIFIVHRRDKFRGAKILQDRIFKSPNIEVIWNAVVKEIIGEQSVKGVIIEDVKNAEKKSIECGGVFVFIGFQPNTSFLDNFVEIDESGYIITDETMQTSRKGVFACGDVRQKTLRQIVTACGDGAVAAFSAEKYIEELVS